MPSMFPFLVDSPLTFAYEPDTGLLSVSAVASMQRQQTEKIQVEPFRMNLNLLLTPETSWSLLVDLPGLENLLLQAKKGRTKSDFLQ
jgi:hypothetical protein